MVETVDTLVAYYRKQILTLHIVFLLLLCVWWGVGVFNRQTVTVEMNEGAESSGYRKEREIENVVGLKRKLVGKTSHNC